MIIYLPPLCPKGAHMQRIMVQLQTHAADTLGSQNRMSAPFQALN